MNENAIKIRGLRKTFKGFELGPLDMTVPTGGIYGLIGPNGAGKTTTIDLLLGMGRESAGEIKILGLDHRRDEVAVKRRIGYVSPDLNFQAWGNIANAIRFTRGFYPDWDHEYCQDLMTRLNLDAGQKIATLSFGSRIKLSLILALSHRPELLILDEPTVGLDAITKQEVFSEMLAAVKEGNRTVLISSHALVEVERFTDYVGMIKNGRMLFEGNTADVVERFRMVDFIGEAGVQWGAKPGLRLIDDYRDRKRALVDLSLGGLETIKSSGASDVSISPVTLEEIFVVLGKDR